LRSQGVDSSSYRSSHYIGWTGWADLAPLPGAFSEIYDRAV